jgi:hypothetical protein
MFIAPQTIDEPSSGLSFRFNECSSGAAELLVINSQGTRAFVLRFDLDGLFTRSETVDLMPSTEEPDQPAALDHPPSPWQPPAGMEEASPEQVEEAEQTGIELAQDAILRARLALAEKELAAYPPEPSACSPEP